MCQHCGPQQGDDGHGRRMPSDEELGALRHALVSGEKKERVTLSSYLDELRDSIDRGHKVAYELEDRLGGILRPYSSPTSERESFVDDELSPLANQIRHLISMQLALNDRLREGVLDRLEL